MRILVEPGRQRGLRAELNIGLICDHDGFTARHLQQGAKIFRVDNLPGRVIRAADEHHFHAVKIGRDARQIQLPVGEGGHRPAGHADGFGADAVHAVGRRAVEHRVLARLAEGADQQFNAFIGAAADQHLLRLDACILRVAFNDRFRLRFRIAVHRLLGQLKRDRGREFVGVQPDVAFTAQTASRLIRRQRADVGAG